MGFVKVFRDGLGFLFFNPRFFAAVLLFYFVMHVVNMFFPTNLAPVTVLDLASIALNGLLDVFFWAFMAAYLVGSAKEYIERKCTIRLSQETLTDNFLSLFSLRLVVFSLSFIGSVLAVRHMEEGGAVFLLASIFFFFDLVPVVLFMLAPAAIVLGKESLLGGVKKGLGILKAKPLDYLAFLIVLYVFFGFLFSLPLQIHALYMTLDGSEPIPGMDYLLIVFNAASFVFYMACTTGFYMERSGGEEPEKDSQLVAQA